MIRNSISLNCCYNHLNRWHSDFHRIKKRAIRFSCHMSSNHLPLCFLYSFSTFPNALSAFCGFYFSFDIRISILNLGFAFCHLSLWYENIWIKIGLRLLWCDTKSKSKTHNLKFVMTLCTWILNILFNLNSKIEQFIQWIYTIHIWNCINVQC